jgi:hypothetical protein
MNFITTSLKEIPWVRHGFSTKQGRSQAPEFLQLSPERIVTAKQTHSIKAIVVTAPWGQESRPEADALVTATTGLGIGVFTADCVPVLLASRKDKIIGAVHAGWKGAIGGMVESAVAEMQKLGANPADIIAVIGPCIRQVSYEVSDDFKIPFLAQDTANGNFFIPAEKQGHLLFDLPGYVTERLKNMGIGTIEDTQRDTLAEEEFFFSYRRSCQRAEPNDGRQLSVISLA